MWRQEVPKNFFNCSCDSNNSLSIFRSILKFNLDALLQLLFQFASVILIEDFKGIDNDRDKKNQKPSS